MPIDTEHIQFWLTIMLTIVVPLLGYVLRNQEQRSEARDKLLRAELQQLAKSWHNQSERLNGEIRTMNESTHALIKFHVEAMQRGITALQDDSKEHRQWLDKLTDGLHTLQVGLVRDYSKKDEQSAELRALESKLDRVHDTLHGGLKEISDRLQKHEIEAGKRHA